MKAFLKSKKAKVFLIGLVALMLKDLLGIDEGTIKELVKVLSAYLIGQGIADHGKHAKIK